MINKGAVTRMLGGIRPKVLGCARGMIAHGCMIVHGCS